MTIKNSFLFCLLFALTNISPAHAQTTFEVPHNVEFKSKDDYAKYEPTIINAAKWLEETDLNKDTIKRKKVDSFVGQWLFESQTIDIHVGEKIEKIYGKNDQLLGIYIANYVRNFLQNKKTATTFSAIKAGLISMMNVYKKGIGTSKSEDMDKLIMLTDENKLDDYINKNFKQTI